MKYKIALVVFGLLFTQVSLGSITGFPDEMIILKCTNPVSGQLAVEVYEFGSTNIIGFLVEGSPVGIGVIASENGFVSPMGKLQNVRLVQIENEKYNFSAYYANMDGSDGEAIVLPVELNCLVSSKK